MRTNFFTHGQIQILHVLIINMTKKIKRTYYNDLFLQLYEVRVMIILISTKHASRNKYCEQFLRFGRFSKKRLTEF